MQNAIPIRRQQWVLAFLGTACAVGVASIYYNQPLLLVMGRDLGAGARAMGFVAVATQVGYALGILLFVPLGDLAERRALMARMYTGASVALLLCALARGIAWMLAASALIGLMAAVTHVALPMAPDLVPEERRGRAIGTVMTGLLLGILLARSFAGWVAKLSHYTGALAPLERSIGGWRTVYVVAALMNLAFVPVIFRLMPRMEPRQSLSYKQAMQSLWTLFCREPLLRESCALGALCFASFSCFWTTLAFLLHTRYGMGPGVAGTFGVVGAAGALTASLAGRMADRRGTRFVVGIAGGVLTLSYVVLWAGDRLQISTAGHMAVLVVGVVVLDVGAQMMQVGNQTRIFGLGTVARSRLNTIYMTVYFAGGAVGSALAALAWSRWGWDGVCSLALGLIGLAGLRHATGYSRKHAAMPVHVSTAEQEPA